MNPCTTKLALFCPAKTTDLRPEARRLVGEPVEVTLAGAAEDNEYAGEEIYFVETPRLSHWVPRCDLRFFDELDDKPS